MRKKNEISVIVASYNSARTIQNCLNALIDQNTTANFTITVVDSSDDNTLQILSTFSDRIKIIHKHKRLFAGEARNIGVENTKGDIIAFIDSDCVADRQWVETIANTFNTKTVIKAVGGSIQPFSTNSAISHSEYLLEFSQFFPNSPAKWVKTMPHCNVAYRREVFTLCGMIPPAPKGQDSLFNKKLENRGIRIWFNPEISIKHIHRKGVTSFLKHQSELGMGFVNCRSQDTFFGNWVVRLKLYPLLVLYRFFLTIWRILQWNRKYLFTLPFLLPILCLGLCSWAKGCYSYRNNYL